MSNHPLHIPEADVQALLRIEAGRLGIPLWRNNSGAFQDRNGNWVRYGLCNDSKRVNKHMKSPDLVGIKPTLILPHHVGTIVGIFYAREVKEFPWAFTGTDEELAQARFLQLILNNGGNAGFINSVRGL